MRIKQYRLEIAMLAGVGVASVLSGIAPASRAVWLTEMLWAWGLVAILLVTLGAVCSAALFMVLNRNEWNKQ